MKKETTALVLFVAFKFYLQYQLVHPVYDLQRDEYLHLDQANHLAWGYLSVPPVTSWISFIIQLLGNSEFWIRFFPALFGGLTLIVVWKTIQILKGNFFALILGATAVLFSSLLRLNILYQPNSLDVLCWTSLYFVLIRYIESEKKKWLFFGAIVFAIGFLNKYNIVFAVAGLIPALLISPHRKIFLDKYFYLAAALALILIMPTLIWQYQHDFPVIYHMKELAATQLVHVDRFDFLRSQLLYFIGSIFVILLGIWALVFYTPFRQYRFFAGVLLTTLGLFILLKAKSYYAIGLYPIYLAFGAVYISHHLNFGWKKYLQPVAILIPVLFFIPMYDLSFPNKSPEYIAANPEKYRELGMLRWEDGKEHPLPQDYADMLGWKELAYKVDSIYNSIPDKAQTLVLCDNYGQAGAVNYYAKSGLRAHSFNAGYVYWFDLSKPYKHLIRVINGSELEKEFKETGALFSESRILDSISNPMAREYGTTIAYFRNGKIDLNAVLKEEIEKVKKREE